MTFSLDEPPPQEESADRDLRRSSAADHMLVDPGTFRHRRRGQ